MKRKEFIKNISLAGVGITLAPTIVIAAKPAIKTYTLPKASIHVPHGNFASIDSRIVEIRALNMKCSVQLFMRNGINPCYDDLKVFSFQSDGQWMSIAITRAGNRTVSGSISGIEVNIESFDSDSFTVAKA